MDVILIPVFILLKSVINLIMIVVLIDVIMGWLIAADIINLNNRFIYSLIDACSRFSNVLLNPIRRKLPVTFGAFDISPIILFLALSLIESIITRLIIKIT